MKIYCLYNEKFHVFLNEVVKYVLNKYGERLNISTLEEIELVDKNVFQYETDGKTISKSKIIVTSRLYELLPCLNIMLLNENNDFSYQREYQSNYNYYSGSYETSSFNSGLSCEKEKEYYKKLYRTLAAKFHPDVIEDNEPMQFLNKLKESWGI